MAEKTLITKEQVLALTSWSVATLHRKVKPVAHRPGKTAREALYDEAEVLQIAGIITGEPEPETEPERTALAVTPKKQTLSKRSQSVIKDSQNVLTDNPQIILPLLPHKLAYTIDEAHLLTGATKNYLHGISEMIGGRRLIRRTRLVKEFE